MNTLASDLPHQLIALDVGDARIGVASGRLGSSFAFGRGFIVRRSLAHDIDAIKQIYTQERAERVVVGLPIRHDGADSRQTERVRSFAAQLSAAGLDVVFEDERFTTKLATQGLQHSTLSKQKRKEKGRVDEAAAMLILESYLAKHLQTLPPLKFPH